MLQGILLVILQTTCAYILLLVLSKLVGRKLLARITYFDFLIGVTFGSLTYHISLGGDNSFLSGITAALIITLLTVLTDYLNIKSRTFRKLEEGKPVILISNGQILNGNLKKVRISIEKLSMLLRQKDVFDISDINYAILETDGEMTILKKPPKQSVAAGDFQLAGTCEKLACDLILEGKIQYSKLRNRNLDEKWLLEQLALQNVHDVKKVFYACLSPSGKLYVSTKADD